jgi:L,D-transpeptidase catalytic domain
MMKPRSLLLIFFLLLSFTWLLSSGVWKIAKTSWAAESPKPVADPSFKKTQLKAADAKLFVQEKGYNETICILVDMSLPSGQARLFVYNLTKDTVRNAGLVTHGRCNQYWLNGRKYGNTIGCGCSSLGKYKIGRSYLGRFGLAYKLHGLDKTNDKAFERFVVLHSHECVPVTEVKDEICQSDGCPTVAPGFLQYLKPIINASKKPVLLWIYE